MGARHKPREGLHADLVAQFAARVRARFPGAPRGEAGRIARYACGHATERVGALAGLDGYLDHAVELAVVAHLRHRFTPYERLLRQGLDRDEARDRVTPEVLRRMAQWGDARAPPQGELLLALPDEAMQRLPDSDLAARPEVAQRRIRARLRR